MKMNRKQKRDHKRKLKKESSEKIIDLEDKVSAMPSSCGECNALFDKTDNTLLDKWRIAIYDDGPIYLVCPKCVPADINTQQNTI